MSNGLRALLTLLVLVCTGFVQVTGEVSWAWLGPFYVLTALAPWLARYNENPVSRFLWNGGVFFIFAVLVNDATKSGVQYMLADGLILAAFCQVHLLNNLGRRQNPDLLFFNSFLIVLVTCFFSDDVTFMLLFLPWAYLQIASMQFASLARDERVLPTSTRRWVFLSAAKRTAITLALCGLSFVVVPRDFTREGLAARFARGGSDAIGFSEEIRLGTTKVSSLERAVLRITRHTPQAAWPEYWRGATMSSFEQNRWLASSDVRTRRIQGDQTLVKRALDEWQSSPRRDRQSSFDVDVLDSRARRIFLPSETASFRIDASMDAEGVNVRRDGTVTYERPQHRQDKLRYRVTRGPLLTGSPQRGGITAYRRDLAACTRLSDIALLGRAKILARELASGRRAREAQHRYVERMRLALSQRQAYALPGEDGAAKSLDDFLAGAKGHCELFATALALALRSEDIPCRLVSGFRIHPYSETNTIVVLSKQAHAWVEVWDPKAGWYSVDATPARSGPAAETGPGLFDQVRAALTSAWKTILGLDEDSRAAALRWLQDLPGALARAPRTHPGLSFLTLALLALLIRMMRSRRRGRRPAPVIAYEDAVRRSGLTRSSSETPREFLARARAAGIEETRLDELARATETHERARYAPT